MFLNNPETEKSNINKYIPPRRYNASQKTKKCVFFMQGFCRKGEECRFLHEAPSNHTLQNPNAPETFRVFQNNSKRVNLDQTLKKNIVKNEETEPNQTTSSMQEQKLKDNLVEPENKKGVKPDNSQKKASKMKCFYFSRGKCRRGDACPFRHVNPKGVSVQESETKEKKEDVLQNVNSTKIENNFERKNPENDLNNKTSDPFQNSTTHLESTTPTTHLPPKIPPPPTTLPTPSTQPHNNNKMLSDQQLKQLELDLLFKRFPKAQTVRQGDDEDPTNTTSISFTFKPTDPDWVCS